MATFNFGEANGTTLETIDSKWAGDSTLLEVQSGFLQVITANGLARFARYENGQGNAQTVQLLRKAGANPGTNIADPTLQDNGTNRYEFRCGATGLDIRRNGVYQTDGSLPANATTNDLTIKARVTAGGVVSVWVASGAVSDAEISGTLVASFTDGSPLTGGFPGIRLAADGTATDARIDDWTDFEGGDSVPDAFTFTDQTGVTLSTSTTSNEVLITGITSAAAISITGGEYSIAGGAWTSAAGTVTNGQGVRVRVTSSATPRTAVSCTLTVGGVSDTFSVTTGHVRSTSSGSSDTLGQKTVTVTKPAGATTNDVLIVDVIDVNNDTPGAWGNITSTGWTVEGTPVGSGAGGYSRVTRMRRTIRADTLNGNNVAAEPASYTFTTSYGGQTYRLTAAMVCYVGIDPNTPADVTTLYQFNTPGSTNIVAPSLTPVTAAGTVLVSGYAGGSGNENLSPTDDITAPAGQFRRVKRSENNGDAFVAIADQDLTGTTATGTRTATWPVSTTSFGISSLLRVGTGGLGISSVSTDNVINAGEASAAIVGTGFGATQGTGGVSIIQGAITIAQTVATWADTLVTFNAVFEQTGADFAYGAGTLRLTINGGAFVDFPVTIAPALGNIFVTIATPDLVNGIQTTPPLAPGDQLEARGFLGNAAPSGLTITDAGVPEFSANSNHFQVRCRDVSDGEWGAWETWLDTRLILVTDPMSFTAATPSAGLRAQRRLVTDTMAVTADLRAVTFTYQAGRLDVIPCTVVLQPVDLRINRRLVLEPMAFTAVLRDVDAPTIVPPLPVGRKPLPPQSVLVSSQSPQGVTLSWPTQVDHGGSGLAGFNVYRDFEKVNTSLVPTGTYTDDPPGDEPRRYRYHVTTVALNNEESDASPFVEVQTETRGLSFRITPLGGIEWVYD